tara:strand:+ start:200 stop:661 length:462 start_codon:yes stop_codon:yes gene_type:complete
MKLTSLLIILVVIITLPLVAADDFVPPVGDKPVLEGDTAFNVGDFQGFEDGEIEIDLIPELQPLVDTIQPLLKRLSLLVGGLFGLYLILILARVYYERKKVKLLEAIRYDLDRWNMHNGVISSKQRKGVFKSMIDFFKRRAYHKEVRKNDRKD